MNNPKVLIYMSCYNHEKFVREAMDSIIGQTYRNWELFVVNDASTDDTGKILESYQDERVHFYDFATNTKFVGASNFLQDLMMDMQADYIATMSSDDKWELDKLECQIKILQRHPEYKACFTWDKILFEYDDKVYKNCMDYSHRENQNRYEWFLQFFLYGNCLNACSMLMDKTVFYELGRMNQSFFSLADYRLWLRLVSKYPFYLEKKELTYYRRHEKNISRSLQENYIRGSNEQFTILKDILCDVKKEDFERIFYRQLVYHQFESEEEFLAEKFIFLLNTEKLTCHQLAMDLYLSNSENTLFMKILQERYGFTPHDFVELTGNSGLVFLCNALAHTVVLDNRERKEFVPYQVFLTQLDTGKIDENQIGKFSYNVLTGLEHYTSMYEGGEGQFLTIKNYISALRRNSQRGKRKRILYLIAENSQWDIFKEVENKKWEGEIFYSYVPELQKMFEAEEYKTPDEWCTEELQYLEIYDGKEHCLRFTEELGLRMDVIFYVDCIETTYECHDMLGGYSLATEQNCILRKDTYERIKSTDKTVFSIMENIQVYE